MIPLDELLTPPTDRMPAVLSRYQADRAALERRFPTPFSPPRHERMGAFLAAWQDALDRMPFDEFGHADRLDWLLFRNLLDRERERLDRAAEEFAEVEPLLPFAHSLIALDDARRDHTDSSPDAAADVLADALDAIKGLKAAVEAQEGIGESVLSPVAADVKPTVAFRAANVLDKVKATVKEWYEFRAGYDPSFTWWCEAPYKALDAALGEYTELVRKRLAGADDPDTIIGDPVGRDALTAELRRNYIPYSPEELIARAETERAWCLAELRAASREMGFGDDYRAAMEAVKRDHEPPGGQPGMVRDLALEAIAWVTERDLITVPELARDGWRMTMLSAERQKVSPFFLGGETIYVSFPTSDMEHRWKRMSQRGNNRHFSRATVQHELIPGHYMQSFFSERYRPYRRLFWSPFWVEGWTLHWEMLLWELGFPRTPQERIGMLFWRLHRCARVVFSLGFHLGTMTPAECVALLTDEVGHERENALAEVRRSFQGSYDPLYQAAYLIGGFQVHTLYREATDNGKMIPRQFHDRFLRENYMPIPAMRAALLNLPLEKDMSLEWQF